MRKTGYYWGIHKCSERSNDNYEILGYYDSDRNIWWQDSLIYTNKRIEDNYEIDETPITRKPLPTDGEIDKKCNEQFDVCYISYPPPEELKKMHYNAFSNGFYACVEWMRDKLK